MAHSKKDTSTVVATREAVVTLFKILFDTDKTVMLKKYNGGSKQGVEEATEKNIDLPTTMGGLKRYTKALRPVKIGGGVTWINIKVRHDVPILELIDYARDDLREVDVWVYIQPVQHHDVMCIGRILALHGDSEVPFWQGVLEDEFLKKHHKRGTIGLRSKAPMGGVKKIPFKPGTVQERAVKSLHVEVHKDLSDLIINEIREILKGPNFKKFTMTGDIRLDPQYDWSEGAADKNKKIKRCIKIQGRFQAQLSSEEVLELTNIDYKMPWLNNETLREKIMDFKKKDSVNQKLFVAVEKRWIGQGYDMYYPTIHKEEALEYNKHLPFYLTRAYG